VAEPTFDEAQTLLWSRVAEPTFDGSQLIH